MRSPFKITKATVREKGISYQTFLVRGWLNGRRIRKQFKSHDEALGEKNRCEVQAANLSSETRSLNTRLNPHQLAEAEAAFYRLGSQSLGHAVEWFLANYRPPLAETSIEVAAEAFKADRALFVSPSVVADYRKLMARLTQAFPGRAVHTIKVEELQQMSTGQPKTQNNFRANVHAFWEFCRADARRWAVSNPAKGLRRWDVARGLPQILSAETTRELFAFLENYDGPPRSKQARGYLVPYFALATFAGIRPSVRTGELFKIHQLADKSRIIDPAVGVIRITPDLAKTNDLRQIKIRPNLAAWLTRFPIERFPIMGALNFQDHVGIVRKKFSLADDVLRHSFISMHVAKFKSLGEAALEAGNSERIIRRHYLNLVTDAEAEAFWSIVPKQPESATK